MVIARQSGDNWYVAALNAEKEVKKIKVNLPMLAGEEVDMYYDNKKDRTPELKKVKVGKSGELSLEILPNGAVILKK